MLDNLNLTHMNGRVYDQVVGRFLSADPNVPRPGFTQSHNRFSYTANSPLSFIDPSGFEEEKKEKKQDSWINQNEPTSHEAAPSMGGATFTSTRIDFTADLNANLVAFSEGAPLHDLNTREFSWADAGVLEEVVTTDSTLEDDNPQPRSVVITAGTIQASGPQQEESLVPRSPCPSSSVRVATTVNRVGLPTVGGVAATGAGIGLAAGVGVAATEAATVTSVSVVWAGAGAAHAVGGLTALGLAAGASLGVVIAIPAVIIYYQWQSHQLSCPSGS
jgi:RHS repeat-associated protein